MLLAELTLKLKNPELAFLLFTRLNKDAALQKNLYLYSSVLFGLGMCHVFFERYDVAYVHFMKANTVWPNSHWASFSSENATFCIEKLGGELLALEQFHKNTKVSKSTDNLLSLAYHAYYLKPVREKALKASYFYLNHAFKLNPKDTITLRFIGNLHQEMNERGIKEWNKNENILFNIADYYREEKQPHKAQKIYHNWFNAIEKQRLSKGKSVSMLCLLTLEAECYEEMGHPRKALEVLQRQASLFSHPNESSYKYLQKKQDLLDTVIKKINDTALDLVHSKKQQVSPDVRANIKASLTHWQSNANIRPGIGYLRFFTPEESKANESTKQDYAVSLRDFAS